MSTRSTATPNPTPHGQSALINRSALVERPVLVAPLGDPTRAMHPQRAFSTSPRFQRHVAAVQVNVVGAGWPARAEHDAPIALGRLIAHLGQRDQEQRFQHVASAILHYGAMIGKAHGYRPVCHRLGSRPVEQHHSA